LSHSLSGRPSRSCSRLLTLPTVSPCHTQQQHLLQKKYKTALRIPYVTFSRESISWSSVFYIPVIQYRNCSSVILKTSVVDPVPDPRIRTHDGWIRIQLRIRLLSSVNLRKRLQTNNFCSPKEKPQHNFKKKKKKKKCQSL
jgi:hypothetical protein